MSMINKGKKRLALLLAVVLFISLFPAVYAEDWDADIDPEDVTAVTENEQEEVTEPEPEDEEPDPFGAELFPVPVLFTTAVVFSFFTSFRELTGSF